MGAVIGFPRMRRGLCETPASVTDATAVVVILPAIRIERACAGPAGPGTKPTKSPARRKRRRRASATPALSCKPGRK